MKIASIDKHPVLRLGLSVILKNYFKDVTFVQAENIHSFQSIYKDEAPDIFVIDFPDESKGAELCVLKALMTYHPAASFIVFTEMPDYELAMSCMIAGVKGYLPKNSDVTTVMQCIETVMQGKRYLCTELASMAVNECFELVA